MAAIDWEETLDLERAVHNVRTEFPGDWHRDPWGWPELGFMLTSSGRQFAIDNCLSAGAHRAALIDVPKENWGARPAVVLDIADRLVYQALVDRISVDLIGDLSPSVFGWRLPPKEPEAGNYSHNDIQWENYRRHLSRLVDLDRVALTTDVVSFFASIPLEGVRDRVSDLAPQNAVTARLFSFLDGMDRVPERSGLPQRSLASAVLANMVMGPIDDVLEHYATALPSSLGRKLSTFARWMDDTWLFVEDAAMARQAHLELQRVTHALGLDLNSGKTDVLEGNEVAERVRDIEHSAVDAGLLANDEEPLKELVSRVLEDPEHSSRTTIKFMSTRMRDRDSRYRIHDLLAAAVRMPHGADSLSLLFKGAFTSGSLQDWFVHHATSNWAGFEWATSQYARMFTSSRTPKAATRQFYAQAMSNVDSSLSLLAVCAQRMSAWDPAEARTIARDALRRTSNPQARRVLVLSALNAGESRTDVRKWLLQEPENLVTLEFLKKLGYRAPKVVADYAR